MRILANLTAICLVAVFAGCNVFYDTDSVTVNDPVTAPSTSTNCGNRCACQENCGRTCDQECDAKCESGSVCEFTLEDGGEVQCEEGSDCHVTCAGGNCSVECQGSCTVKCLPGAGACGWSECDATRTQCGPRGLACGAECP